MALHLNYDMRGHEIVEGEGLKDIVTTYTRWGFSKEQRKFHTDGSPLTTRAKPLLTGQNQDIGGSHPSIHPSLPLCNTSPPSWIGNETTRTTDPGKFLVDDSLLEWNMLKQERAQLRRAIPDCGARMSSGDVQSIS
ncbi:predicted protein [Histoplasma capsulatum H143]|uniref:Uncharacterized protein n=1 Tax=Ajellomyces capsulatus (strain H143) TaxID=544712 RepID=C6HMC5_AJECH|nr:predicted protein [Histoplasma capsulatum H143]